MDTCNLVCGENNGFDFETKNETFWTETAELSIYIFNSANKTARKRIS